MKNVRICFVKEQEKKPASYTYDDLAGSINDPKSTSGYLFYKKSKMILLSSKNRKE